MILLNFGAVKNRRASNYLHAIYRFKIHEANYYLIYNRPTFFIIKFDDATTSGDDNDDGGDEDDSADEIDGDNDDNDNDNKASGYFFTVNNYNGIINENRVLIKIMIIMM